MKEHYDVIKAALELLNTIEEGLAKSRNLLLQQRYEDAFYMLQDSIEGILSVDGAVQPVLKELKKEQLIRLHSLKLKGSINRLIYDYETNNGSNTLKILISDLEPSFKDWNKDLTKLLTPLYTILTKMVSKYGRGISHKLF